MTVREAEHISSSGHYGYGLVICSGTDFEGHSLRNKCHKDGRIIYEEFHGYQRDQLNNLEIAKLYAQAFLHDQKFPDHEIRILIFERKNE